MFGWFKKKRNGDWLTKSAKESEDYWRNWAREEREKERERQARVKELEDSILDKIHKAMPDLHFKACPWCGKEPTLRVRVVPEYRNMGLFSEDWSDPKEYRIELETCDCLNAGRHLNTYDIDVIPTSPLFANKGRRWDVSWNGGVHPNGFTEYDIPFEDFPIKWEDAPPEDDLDGYYVDRNGKRYPLDVCRHGKNGVGCCYISDWTSAVCERFDYLSDDWPNKCSKCGKKWRGYESCGDKVRVNGESFCHDCAGIWGTAMDGKERPRSDVIRDALNIDSLYIQDNEPRYYTSLESCLTSHKVTEDDCYTVWV